MTRKAPYTSPCRSSGIRPAALLLAGPAALALSASLPQAKKPVSPASASPAPFVAKPTPQQLARGRYLVETVSGCFDCHSPHEYVDGQWRPRNGLKGAGSVFPEGFLPLPPGSKVVAPNITPDRETGIGSWTDADIRRALQQGVAKGGRPLFNLMPYNQFRVLTDEDVKSIIVYLRSLPPVRNPLPLTSMPFPVHVRIDDAVVPPLPPNASAEVRRGWYLTRVAGCTDCHSPLIQGQQTPATLFAGGLHFQGPFGSVFSLNITSDPSGISFMDQDMFVRTLKTGRVNGNGARLNPIMPFENFRNMKTADLEAIYAYLRTVPKVRHRIDNTEPPTFCPIDGEKHGLGNRN